MNILGISAFYHDSAAALVEDGRIVAAAQEERFTRVKHDARFPHEAISYCLEEGGCGLEGIEHVVFYDKPFLKFERLARNLPRDCSARFSVVSQGNADLGQGEAVPEGIVAQRIWQSRPDPSVGMDRYFSQNIINLTPRARSSRLHSKAPQWSHWTVSANGAPPRSGVATAINSRSISEIHFPHSLGLLYSAFTYYTGFKVNSGEYKVMGLAPYGVPRFKQVILDNFIDLREDGSYSAESGIFQLLYRPDDDLTEVPRSFRRAARNPESPLTQREMDLAASIQEVTEEAVMHIARFARRSTGERNLCLAGGVALNCVANGKLQKEKVFDAIWIQPAAGDAGGALGAALAAWHQYAGQTAAQIKWPWRPHARCVSWSGFLRSGHPNALGCGWGAL